MAETSGRGGSILTKRNNSSIKEEQEFNDIGSRDGAEVNEERDRLVNFFEPFFADLFDNKYVSGIAVYNKRSQILLSREFPNAERFNNANFRKYFEKGTNFVNNTGVDLFGEGFLVVNTTPRSIFGFNSQNHHGFILEKTETLYILSYFTEKHDKHDAYSVISRFASDLRFYRL